MRFDKKLPKWICDLKPGDTVQDHQFRKHQILAIQEHYRPVRPWIYHLIVRMLGFDFLPTTWIDWMVEHLPNWIWKPHDWVEWCWEEIVGQRLRILKIIDRDLILEDDQRVSYLADSFKEIVFIDPKLV